MVVCANMFALLCNQGTLLKHLIIKASIGVFCLALVSCNPLKADDSKSILGRWQSDEWTFGGAPAFAEFTSDGKVTYNSDIGPLTSSWTILPENGELKITYRSGSTPPRCKIKFEGASLTIIQPACL